VAAGEIVTASLLALALNDLSVQAVSLDARESGIRVAGSFGDARIQAIASGWRRGRVATLGDGGTDTSAVARAVGIGASRALDHVLSILVGTSQAVEATGAVHGAFVRQRSDNVVPARRAS
jgi:aspartokinase